MKLGLREAILGSTLVLGGCELVHDEQAAKIQKKCHEEAMDATSFLRNLSSYTAESAERRCIEENTPRKHRPALMHQPSIGPVFHVVPGAGIEVSM